MANNLIDEISKLREMLKEAGYDPIDYLNEDGQILVFLPNGYGASVIGQGSLFERARQVGLLELAVIKNNESTPQNARHENWEIVRDTPITCDTIGDLTAVDAFKIIQEIETLKNANSISNEINELKEMLKEAGYDPIDLPDEYGQLVVFLDDCSISVNVQSLSYEPERKEGLLKMVVVNKEPDPPPGVFKLTDPITKDWMWFWGIAHTTSHEYDTIIDLTAKEAFEIIQLIKMLGNDDEK